MRIRARLLLGLYGLLLAVPTIAAAAPLGDDQAGYATAGGQPPPQPAPHHHHKGLLGRRHCVECQRAYVKAHDGVDVPAPPPIAAGAMMHGQVVVAQPGACDVCQGSGVVSGPVTMVNASAPGYAVVDGPGMMANANAPGYAVVGDIASGPEPSPIGVSRAGQDPRMAAMGPRPGAGAYDPSVVPTSIPPAQVALSGPGHDRPHVISHLLGIPKMGTIRRKIEDKERQKHAAIAYDQPGGKVTDLPASMVYGDKNGH
ncbi:MAG TPA: hypothetical protein VHS97_10145 [Isosphaeraceae bacterium]|nr:hypothetical protein [Isosphaeraceae bacterium]